MSVISLSYTFSMSEERCSNPKVWQWLMAKADSKGREIALEIADMLDSDSLDEDIFDNLVSLVEDNESLHAPDDEYLSDEVTETCCVQCGESFKISCEITEYNQGKHEQFCSEKCDADFKKERLGAEEDLEPPHVCDLCKKECDEITTNCGNDGELSLCDPCAKEDDQKAALAYRAKLREEQGCTYRPPVKEPSLLDAITYQSALGTALSNWQEKNGTVMTGKDMVFVSREAGRMVRESVEQKPVERESVSLSFTFDVEKKRIANPLLWSALVKKADGKTLDTGDLIVINNRVVEDEILCGLVDYIAGANHLETMGDGASDGNVIYVLEDGETWSAAAPTKLRLTDEQYQEVSDGLAPRKLDGFYEMTDLSAE